MFYILFKFKIKYLNFHCRSTLFVLPPHLLLPRTTATRATTCHAILGNFKDASLQQQQQQTSSMDPDHQVARGQK